MCDPSMKDRQLAGFFAVSSCYTASSCFTALNTLANEFQRPMALPKDILANLIFYQFEFSDFKQLNSIALKSSLAEAHGVQRRTQ